MGSVKCDLVLQDSIKWIKIEEIGVCIEFMYCNLIPQTCYFSKIGMTGDEEEVIFTPKAIPLLIDTVFLSTVLGDFVERRKYLDSRLEYDQMDYYLSLICIADKYCDCEIFFNITPNLLFEGKHWVSTMEGLAVYIEADWERVIKWAWELQEQELQALIIGLKEDNCKRLSEEFRIKEISRYEKMLVYDRQVLSDWEMNKAAEFIKISWERV